LNASLIFDLLSKIVLLSYVVIFVPKGNGLLMRIPNTAIIIVEF
jgi:hypothetical protein